jgi:DNA-binding NarL/FixJ family response regulator
MTETQITVCIVEDRIDIREALAALVNSQLNLSCIGTYENAEDALVGIPELQPNVVLMDIDLPKMNGIECIKLLKPKCPRVQFMICTVYDEDEKVFEALRTGANGYILKRSPPVSGIVSRWLSNEQRYCPKNSAIFPTKTRRENPRRIPYHAP